MFLPWLNAIFKMRFEVLKTAFCNFSFCCYRRWTKMAYLTLRVFESMTSFKNSKRRPFRIFLDPRLDELSAWLEKSKKSQGTRAKKYVQRIAFVVPCSVRTSFLGYICEPVLLIRPSKSRKTRFQFIICKFILSEKAFHRTASAALIRGLLFWSALMYFLSFWHIRRNFVGRCKWFTKLENILSSTPAVSKNYGTDEGLLSFEAWADPRMCSGFCLGFSEQMNVATNDRFLKFRRTLSEFLVVR